MLHVSAASLLVFTCAVIANGLLSAEKPTVRGLFPMMFDEWPFVKSQSADETENGNDDDSPRPAGFEMKEDINDPPLLPPVFEARMIVVEGTVETQNFKYCFDFPKQRMAMWGIANDNGRRAQIYSCKLGVVYDFNSTQCNIQTTKCSLTRKWWPLSPKLINEFMLGKRSAGIPVQLWTGTFSNSSGWNVLVDSRDASPVSTIVYDTKFGKIAVTYLSNLQTVVDQSCFTPASSCNPSLQQNAAPDILEPLGNSPTDNGRNPEAPAVKAKRF